MGTRKQYFVGAGLALAITALSGPALAQTAAPSEPKLTPPPLPTTPVPPPLPSETQFYYEEGGRPPGPINLAELKAKVAAGAVGQATLLRISGTPGWLAARNLVDLASTFQSAPALATPGSTQPAPLRAVARGLTDVSWTTLTDPFENAFSIDVPQGWRVAGGEFRNNQEWASMVLRVLSPDRRTLIAFGHPDVAPYFNAPIAARDYIRRFTESAMSTACPQLQIRDIVERPEYVRFALSRPFGSLYQWSAAEASFTCSGSQRGAMDGRSAAIMQYQPSVRSGHPQVLAAFVTTAGQEDAADHILNHILQSIRPNPQWSVRQVNFAGEIARRTMARWQGEQRQFQQMDDAITNTAHFVGPGGKRYDLDARPRFQWLLPNGQTVGTDTPTPPGAGLTPLRRQPD